MANSSREGNVSRPWTAIMIAPPGIRQGGHIYQDYWHGGGRAHSDDKPEGRKLAQSRSRVWQQSMFVPRTMNLTDLNPLPLILVVVK